jgi:hypothetical protein
LYTLPCERKELLYVAYVLSLELARGWYPSFDQVTPSTWGEIQVEGVTGFSHFEGEGKDRKRISRRSVEKHTVNARQVAG